MPCPDSDGSFGGAVLDIGSGIPESGEGVLDRLNVRANSGAAAGIYPLTLVSNGIVDASGTDFAPRTTNGALIAVNAILSGRHADSRADGQPFAFAVTHRFAISNTLAIAAPSRRQRPHPTPSPVANTQPSPSPSPTPSPHLRHPLRQVRRRPVTDSDALTDANTKSDSDAKPESHAFAGAHGLARQRYVEPG